MKRIKDFENHRNNAKLSNKKKENVIKEAVMQVNDVYKVNTMIDIPQSLINAYVKKVKDTTGDDIRKFFGDVNIAEEIVKYLTKNFLDVDHIPAGALTGKEEDIQETPQEEPQAQVQPQAQPQVQEEPQEEPESETQTQAQDDEFEEPQAQTQAQDEEESQDVDEDEDDELPL